MGADVAYDTVNLSCSGTLPPPTPLLSSALTRPLIFWDAISCTNLWLYADDATNALTLNAARNDVPMCALHYAGAEIEYNSQAAYDPETKMLYTAAQHANSFAIVNMSNPTNPELAGLLQDSNRTARNETFAGATGCTFDSVRKLAFVASEYSKTFAVVEVANPDKPQIVGTVTHPALSGEAVQYDHVRQRAFVASRTASALVVVDVRSPTAPAVIGIFSSKQNSTADAVSIPSPRLAAAAAAGAETAAATAADALLKTMQKVQGGTKQAGSEFIATAVHWPHCLGTESTGVVLTVGPTNVSFCNITAWTFRQYIYNGKEVLSPTGFTQTVSNVNIAPNTGQTVWPPVHPISPAAPPVKQGANGPPAPGSPGGSGFLGTGHGGEYVFSVELYVTPKSGDSGSGGSGTRVYNLLGDGKGSAPPLPAAGLHWPAAVASTDDSAIIGSASASSMTLTVVKQSQIGPFLTTERVELDAKLGMLVSANYTVAYENATSLVNFLYPCKCSASHWRFAH